MQIIDVYTKKEYECKKCNGKLHYGKIAKDDGSLYTTDGQVPNGKFGKESNVLSGAVDATVQDRLHQCSAKFVLEAIEKIDKGEFSTQSSNTDVDLSKFKAEHLTIDDEVLWSDMIAKCAEYAILAQKKLQEYPELSNPALKGLITKVAFDVLTQYKKEQRTNESD